MPRATNEEVENRRKIIKEELLKGSTSLKISKILHLPYSIISSDISNLGMYEIMKENNLAAKKKKEYEEMKIKEDIINDYKNGMSIPHISEKYNKSVNQLRYILKIHIEKERTETRDERERIHKNIIQEYKEGNHNLISLAEKYNRTIESIRKILREKGGLSLDKNGNIDDSYFEKDRYIMKSGAHLYNGMTINQYEEELYSIIVIKNVLLFLLKHPASEYDNPNLLCYSELFDKVVKSNKKNLQDRTKSFIAEVKEMMDIIIPYARKYR